jgi:hypothetical protein
MMSFLRIHILIVTLISNCRKAETFEEVDELSRARVIIDRAWIGNRICWIFKHTNRDYALEITVTHRQVFSVTDVTALLCNVFQQWTFLCSRSHVLAGWRPCHPNLLHF